MKPSICNSGYPVSLPEICGNDFVFLPINKLTDVNPDRNHAYVLPNDDVYIVNHGGSRVIKLSSASSNSMFDEVTDGLEIVTVNKIQLLRVRVGDGILINDDNQIIIDPKLKYVLPVATEEILGGIKIGDHLSSDKDGKVSVDLSLEDLGGQAKLSAGSGIIIDGNDSGNPTISTESNTHVLPNGTNGIAIADDKVALTASNMFSISVPDEENPKIVMIIRRNGGSLALAYLQPYLTAGKGIEIDETNPKAPIISLDGDYAKKEDLTSHVNDKENPHEVTAHQVGAFTEEESSANVINSIGGTSSAILKKELLVNGTEGTASRYVKDLPYQNKLFSSGDPYKKTELFAIQSLEGTQDYIDGARVFKSKGNWSAARVMKKNIDLFGFDYSKKYVLCEMMKWVPNDRDDKETCDIGYYASGNITDETNTIVAKIPARDTYTLVKSKVLTFNSEAIDTAQFRLEPSNIIPDGSTSRGSLYRYGLGLYESGKEPSDGWYPSCEDYGIVHGQPNLLNGTSNEWKEYTVQSWDDGTYKSVKLGDIGLKVGDTITFASELDHKSGIGYASSKLHFFDANNTSLGQKTGNGIMAGNKGVASITTEIPTGATSLRWYNFTKSNNTDLGTIAVRGHKLIKGTLATMDEWTPSQSDSGLTPINEGMVPFTDDEYATLLSSDGIVRAETDIVGRGAEIQFDFDVIGTLEDRYPYVFEGLTTAKQKSDKFFELVRTVSLSHTSRGYGYLGSSLQNNCRAYQVTLSASGTINWGLGDRQPSSNFVEKTGLFTIGNLQQFHDNRFYKITVSTKSNRGINPDTSVSSDGITPAWVEVKDIRLIVELEVNGRTIIEEMIAAYSGENSLRIVNDTAIVGQDWNTITKQGIYEVQQATGANKAGNWGTLQVNRVGDSDIVSQTFIDYDSISIRRRTSGERWSDWSRFTNNILPPGIETMSFSAENASYIESGSIDFVKIGEKMQVTFDFVAKTDMQPFGIGFSDDSSFSTYQKASSKQTTVKNGEVFETWIEWNKRNFFFGNGLRAGDHYVGTLTPIVGA